MDDCAHALLAVLQEDWLAHQAMNAELEAFRDDVGRTWLQARPGPPNPPRLPCRWRGIVLEDRLRGARAGSLPRARQLLPVGRPPPAQEPLGIEETAERYVRPPLREAFVALCRGSVADYLARFGFRSELLQAMYAVRRPRPPPPTPKGVLPLLRLSPLLLAASCSR